MEIINISNLGMAVALGFTVQYFTDKMKLVIPRSNDKIYSIAVGLLAFALALGGVIAFQFELFNSQYQLVNYLLTAGVVAGGAGGVDSFLATLRNVKNNTKDGGNEDGNV